jgi:hypothetical protein
MGQSDSLPNGSLFFSPPSTGTSPRTASPPAGSGATDFPLTAHPPSDRIGRKLALWETSWIDLGGEG